MKKHFVLCLLAAGLGCLLGGCAADQTTAADNPYHLEQNTGYAHGEVDALYGRTAGH
ncbi:MAG: hypothetical protein ACREIF_13555 [Chthoniobacterales bacterium]